MPDPVFFRVGFWPHIPCSNCVCTILINLTFDNGGRINLHASVDSSICSLIEFDLKITLHEFMYMHILSTDS